MNSAASPVKRETIEPGRPTASSARATPSMAAPRAAPGATSNEIVEAGNCSSCATERGAAIRVTAEKAESGTAAPAVPGT